MASVTIDFPETGDVLFGNGALVAWGTHDPPGSPVVAFIERNGTFWPGTPLDDPPGTCTWAFWFEGVPATMVDVHLTVCIPDENGDCTEFSDTVTFQCKGHARIKKPKPREEKQEEECEEE